jgi:hypothetical protein
MMKRIKLSGRIFLALIFFLLCQYINTGTSLAMEMPPGPDRYTSSIEKYTQYIWWLTQWADNKVVCDIIVDHTGNPSGFEIIDSCGDDIYSHWLSSDVCDIAITDSENCTGLYLQLISETTATRSVPVKLPPAMIWVTLQGCLPYASTHRCTGTPSLVLSGEEPLAGYSILRLEGTINDDPFVCEPECLIDLAPTDEDGITINFWAYSSYGDSSELFTARVRVQQGSDGDDPYMFVDILSDQWRGLGQAPCMDIWNVFPPLGGLTNWLSTPSNPTELATNISYEYLAGALIKNGAVETSPCIDGGLLGNGYANPCGVEAAREEVREWQNQFDELIYISALEVGVPAQLLKNIFSRESQFWPGVSTGHPEAGLGQMTRNGADTTLLWNIPFYEQFCAGILGDSICEKGYSHLSEKERELLQVSLVRSVDAYCLECPLSIDIEKAEASIFIFANALIANCAQTDMVIDLNYAGKGFTPSYEDFWKFTLVNYNAGPGCLGLAVNKTSSLGELLTWENVSEHFTSVCKPAQDYVRDISTFTP